ncbi:MAG: response regulator [Gemmatimonadales bacterium]
MSETIRIVMADDHALVREGIRRVLGNTDDIEVVAEAGNGNEVMDVIRQQEPDVALLDISMPGRTGLELTREIKATHDCKVLILSMHDHARYVAEAVKAGADGYVLKDSGPQELRSAIRAVAAGETYFAPVAAKMGEALRGADETATGIDALTAREREVLIFIAKGLTNKQIAGALGISPRTVETHRESVMNKTGIRSVAGLTKAALERGLVE